MCHVLCIPYVLIPNCFAFATSAVLQQNSARAIWVPPFPNIFLLGNCSLTKSIKTWSLPWSFSSTAGMFPPSNPTIVPALGSAYTAVSNQCVCLHPWAWKSQFQEGKKPTIIALLRFVFAIESFLCGQVHCLVRALKQEAHQRSPQQCLSCSSLHKVLQAPACLLLWDSHHHFLPTAGAVLPCSTPWFIKWKLL